MSTVPTPIGSPHRLTDADVQRGIVALAQTLLGDRHAWPSLVSANGLVPPYLTLDPTQVYGPALAQATVRGAIAQGSTTIPLPDQSLAIWGPATIAVLAAAGGTATGAAILTEAVPMAAYNGTTLTLAAATQNAYPAGARIQAFTAYPGQTLQVLMPGDVIYVPITQPQGLVLSAGQRTDTYGTDLAAPMTWTGIDAAQVSGLALLAQRLRVRFGTPLGSVPGQSTYGFPNLIGTATTSVRWAAAVRQGALQEPGVQDVTDITVTVTGSTVTLGMICTVSLSGSLGTASLPLTVTTQP